MREDWIECSLGDLFVLIKNGSNIKQTEDKTGIPVSRIETIWNEGIDWNRVKYALDFDKDKHNQYLLIENDILFSHINSDSHLGKTAIFREKNKTLIHGINLLLMRPNSDLVGLFLLYFLRFHKYSGGFLDIAQRSVNQSSINQTALKKVTLSIPSKPEQRAIVKKIESLFNSLDAGVADLKKAQQQLKIYRQAVLKKAFEGEWEQVKLEDVAKWGSGGTPSRKNSSFFIGSIPWVKTGELNTKFIYDSEEKISEEAIKKSSAKLFPKDSVAIAMYGATIGKASIFGSEMSTNQACAVGQCYANIFNEFLYYFLVSQKQEFIKLGIGGAQPNISQGTIKNYPIKLPSLGEQYHIVKQIESRLSVCDSVEQNIKESLEKAEALRKSILKKAFDGNLLTEQELTECKQAKDYEPAGILLERIKTYKK